MISFSVTYVCVLLFSGSCLHVFADKDSKDCCCDDKRTANVFNIPVRREDLNKQYNYTNGSANVFRHINNDTDITHTAEVLDRGFYTALCWSEIITIVENRNGSNSVKREFAITFETKSDIPEKYLKVDDHYVEPEYKQYEIYDETTKKSQIVNFTTISRSDDTVVRESRKMFCGSGPIFTRELISWAQTDRKRVEFKVSPKKQNLILNGVKPSATPPPLELQQRDSTQKPYSTQTGSRSTEASTVPKSETSRSDSKWPDPPDATVINLPELVVNTDEFDSYLKPDNGMFSPPTQGNVPPLDFNVNIPGSNRNYDKPGDVIHKTEAQSLSTSSPDQPFTPQSSTVTPFLERSSTISSTTPTTTEYSATTDKTSLNSGSTTSDEDNSDTSEALDENERMDWKTTECDTTYTVEKETPPYSTNPPELKNEPKRMSTGPVAKEVIGYDIGANRYGNGNDYGFLDEDKPEGTRNSTRIEFHRPVQYPNYEFGSQCDVPKQKMVVKVRITLNDVLESTEPNNVFSTNFPVMAIEKQLVIPIEKIQRVPRVPDFMVNLEWDKFMNDVGFHFFALHEEYIQNYTQLVNEILNSSPISELDDEILPEETVRRLQSISNYLKFCERVNGRQDVKPEYRISGRLGEPESETNFNDPNYGFYNYLLSPQYGLNSNYRPQTDHRVPYIKESTQPTLSQLMKFVDMQKFPNVMHTMQGYSSLRNPFNNGAWKGQKNQFSNNKFPLRIKKASDNLSSQTKT